MITTSIYRLRRFSSASAVTAHTSVPNSIISLLRSTKDPGRILEIVGAYNLTSQSQVNHHQRLALTAAVTNLAASNAHSSIRSLLFSFSPHDSIILFGHAGMVDDAHQVFSSQNRHTSPKSLNALLFALLVNKNYKEIVSISREYIRKYRIPPDITTYNTVIKALCLSNSSSSVFAFLEEMWRKGVKPNATSYNTLIAGLYSEEKIEDVDRVLHLMKSNNCSIGISTQNARIQSLCKLRRSKDAKELLEKMVSRGMRPNSVTYHNLIHGFCREGDLEEAKRLFVEMEQRDCAADGECYFTMIHYLCRGGEFEEGLRLCKESMERNWIPRFSVMKGLVEWLVACGRSEDAKEIAVAVKRRFDGGSIEMWKEIEDGLNGGDRLT